ncbi:hypothetical protein HYV49_00880 [Candidatus Pacearchaeota archaeon]|nr:hypothetical protein [Candidatus Pacearchaeota archaeon]
MPKDMPLSEITLRKYEKPYKTDKRELVKKICLSLGLLQPGDGRDVVVDIMLALIDASKTKARLSSDQIKLMAEEIRKKHSLEIKGLTESNVRRQLKRLRDLMIVEKSNNLYNLAEFEALDIIFKNKIENFLIPDIVARIKEYLSVVFDEKG